MNKYKKSVIIIDDTILWIEMVKVESLFLGCVWSEKPIELGA